MDKSIDGKAPGLDQLHDEMANALMRFIQANRGLMGAAKKHDEGMDPKADVETWGLAMGSATALAEDALRKYAAVASGELAPPPKEEDKGADETFRRALIWMGRAESSCEQSCTCVDEDEHHCGLPEIRRDKASLAALRARLSPAPKQAGRECWVGFNRYGGTVSMRNKPTPAERMPYPGVEWVRMVESPQGAGECGEL